MNSSFFNSSIFVLFSLVFLIVFVFSIFYSSTNLGYVPENYISSESSIFSWPTPNFYTISSYFGYRNKPTEGASTYHSGIDIVAPARF